MTKRPAQAVPAPAIGNAPVGSPHGAVPVVGIGASAGGLDPICEFLVSVPPASGFAYVIVQHLDPLHKAMLTELLQRVTRMPVHEIEDGMAVEADHVYVIPPNRDLGFDGQGFAVLPSSGVRGQRFPIDTFFQALAARGREQAVAAVFSGMGADGTAGL